MKKSIYKKICAALVAPLFLASCGNNFLDQDPYQGVDLEDAITEPEHIATALNGVYFTMGYYNLYGRTLTALPDLASDNAAHSFGTNHLTSLYSYSYNENDAYITGIWKDAYKAIDHSARIIKKSESLLQDTSTEDKLVIKDGLAQAYALRACATMIIANVYCLPYSSSNLNQMGAVLVDQPISVFDPVKRSTLGETYSFILKDLEQAASYAEGSTVSSSSYFVMNKVAITALQARIYLYMGNYEAAAEYAAKAIEQRNGELTYDVAEYAAMYDKLESSDEDIFAIAKSSGDYLSANSINTLYTNYGVSISNTVKELYDKADVRYPVAMREGGKYAEVYTNVPVIRLPEMYLILAEAQAQLGAIADAQDALLVVAKRNKNITQVSDLPAEPEALLVFIAQERQRELVQEGHRLYDLRRTETTAFVAGGASKLENGAYLYPIPSAEINTGKGVVQNKDWYDYFPTEVK